MKNCQLRLEEPKTEAETESGMTFWERQHAFQYDPRHLRPYCKLLPVAGFRVETLTPQVIVLLFSPLADFLHMKATFSL